MTFSAIFAISACPMKSLLHLFHRGGEKEHNLCKSLFYMFLSKPRWDGASSAKQDRLSVRKSNHHS